ncbi:MAG: cytochrome c [Ignavibacteriae bacterium]|nr:cytochrome c [Ignavibacteriota bacterium]
MNLFHLLLPCFIIVLILVTGCTQEKPATQLHNNKLDSTKNVDLSSLAESTRTATELTYEERQGKSFYEKYCIVCHGQEGKGDGFNAFNLDPKPRDFTDSLYMNALSDARLFEVISQGGRGMNKSNLMPSWSGRMSKDEIEFTMTYIRAYSTSRTK